MDNGVDCAGLDIVGRSNRKPAIAKTDKYFTEASFYKPDWRGRVKEAGKSAQKTQKDEVRPLMRSETAPITIVVNSDPPCPSAREMLSAVDLISATQCA